MRSLLIILALLGQSSWSHKQPQGKAADECGSGLVDQPPAINFTFADFSRQLDIAATRVHPITRQVIFQISEDRVSNFWKKGWPALNQIAQESGLTTRELFTTPVELVELWASENVSQKKAQELSYIVRELLSSIEALSSLKPGQKMKAKQWQMVGLLYEMLVKLGVFAVTMEANFKPYPSLNPLTARFENPDVLMTLFEALDEISLDTVVNVLTRANEDERPTQVEVPDLGDHAIDPNETPPSQLASRPEDSHNLAILLKEGIKLNPDTIYQSFNPRNKSELKVVLSDQVTSMQDRQSFRFRKLLRSIAIGNGVKSGIKFLPEVGDDIVEIKAVMRGHWRIIGCLKGDMLELKKMLELPDVFGSYGRFISKNFCH